MTDSNYKPQLVYIEKKTALNLLRVAIANNVESIPVEDHPANFRMTEPVRDAAGQISRVFWAIWEHSKSTYKLSSEAVGEWTPTEKRETEYLPIEDTKFSGKFTGHGGSDVLEEAKRADGHMTNIFEMRFALPLDVADEIRALQEAEDKSFSWIFKKILENYEFDLTRKGPKPAAAVDPEDLEPAEEEIVVVL